MKQTKGGFVQPGISNPSVRGMNAPAKADWFSITIAFVRESFGKVTCKWTEGERKGKGAKASGNRERAVGSAT